MTRLDAWAQLGTPLEASFTASAAMKEGLLADWDVRTVPMTATLPPDAKGVSRVVEVHERVAVVRDNPIHAGQVDHLGIVSPSYAVQQNEEQVPLLDALAEESGATYSYAVELENGRKALLALDLPGHILVGDQGIGCTVATVKSHDGTKPFTVLVTPTYGGTVLVSHPILKVANSSHSQKIIDQEARRVLDWMFDYLTDFHSSLTQLATTPMSQAHFEALVERHYGAKDDADPRAITRAERRAAQMIDLFGEGRTAWDGFYALATWFDHLSPVRGDTSRAAKALLDPGFKDAALALMTSV